MSCSQHDDDVDDDDDDDDDDYDDIDDDDVVWGVGYLFDDDHCETMFKNRRFAIKS